MQASLHPAKTNHDTGLTGLIAIVCMVIDHLGAVFFHEYTWMRIVGRIAFPLFAWGIAVGAEHTKSMPRYALRLFLLMLISQPFYMYGLNHSLLEFNIFMTLLLGLIGIWGLKSRAEWVTALALMLSYLLAPDYGLRGVLCILLLWAARDNPLMLAITFSTYCVIWGGNYSVIFSYTNEHFQLVLRLQAMAILALPIMLIPRARRTPVPRWFTYAFYPGHLAAIWLARWLLR